jgi:hypothetical protein
MLPSTIKTAPLEIVKSEASQHGGPAAGEVLHRSLRDVLFSAAEWYRQKNVFEIFLKCVWLAVAAIHGEV